MRNALCTVCVAAALASSSYTDELVAVSPAGLRGRFPADFTERNRWFLALASSETPLECHHLIQTGPNTVMPVFAVTRAGSGEPRCAVHIWERP